MSFQAYIDNIKAKTGKTPEDFKSLAEKRGFISSGEVKVKAGEIVAWLKEDFSLGAWPCNGYLRNIQRKNRIKIT